MGPEFTLTFDWEKYGEFFKKWDITEEQANEQLQKLLEDGYGDSPQEGRLFGHNFLTKEGIAKVTALRCAADIKKDGPHPDPLLEKFVKVTTPPFDPDWFEENDPELETYNELLLHAYSEHPLVMETVHAKMCLWEMSQSSYKATFGKNRNPISSLILDALKSHVPS